MAADAEAQNIEFLCVVGVGDGDRRQAVKRPCREAPVEQSVRRRPPLRLDASWRSAERWCVIIEGPLGDAPVQESGTDAGAEQHADPADFPKFRFFIRLAQPGLSVPTEAEPNEKPDRGDACQQVEDSELSGDKAV